MDLEAAGWAGSALVASAALIAPLTWLLGRVTRWTLAARWFTVAVIVAPAALAVGFLLAANLSNGDCDDICDTPSWRGFLYGATVAGGAAGHAILSGLLWLSGHRGSSARNVQPM